MFLLLAVCLWVFVRYNDTRASIVCTYLLYVILQYYTVVGTYIITSLILCNIYTYLYVLNL